MGQIRIGCSECAISTVTCIAVYVIRNVFSRLQKTDSDMSSRSAAGKLFHTAWALTVYVLEKNRYCTAAAVSEYAVRAYTTADSAVLYLNHAQIA